MCIRDRRTGLLIGAPRGSQAIEVLTGILSCSHSCSPVVCVLTGTTVARLLRGAPGPLPEHNA
eukprot:7645888-Pyramimonas_sp.AAC.1